MNSITQTERVSACLDALRRTPTDSHHSPALRRKSSSQQAAAIEGAPNGALYLRRSLRVAASGGASEATGEWAGERSAADASLGGANIKNNAFTASSAQSRSRSKHRSRRPWHALIMRRDPRMARSATGTHSCRNLARGPTVAAGGPQVDLPPSVSVDARMHGLKIK